MSYVSVIPSEGEDVQITYFDSLEYAQHVATVQVGYDDETDETFSVLVVLAPAVAEPPQHLELLFYFVRTSAERDSVEEISDGRQTKNIIPDGERAAILDVVCLAAEYLVDVAKPEKVHYITIEPNMPDKAVAKYCRICKAIRERGYHGREVDPYLGTRIWICVRTDS